MQTQCPQCRTAFRVSAEQLELADGKVRCGQCLHVFVADEHFIDKPPTDSEVPEFTLSDIELEANEVELPGELSTGELVHNEIELTDIDISDIEMPVLDSLDDNIEEQVQTETDSTGLLAEVATDSTAETTAETTTPEASTVVRTITSPLSAANETWLERDDGLGTDEPTVQEAPKPEIIDSNEALEELPHEQQPELTGPATDIPDTAGEDESIPLLVETYDASQLYPELEATPKVGQAQHTGLYSLAIIALLAAFLLQGTYALRDTLAGQPALRPLMGDFCAAFNCTLTLPRKPEMILLTRSEIRSHPLKRRALLVKASIQNQARFRQAYPILRLQFSDLDGQALVGRDFMPEEYLPDDVNIHAGMPINTDVNLSLELVDPGGQAVSFDFNLL